MNVIASIFGLLRFSRSRFAAVAGLSGLFAPPLLLLAQPDFPGAAKGTWSGAFASNGGKIKFNGVLMQNTNRGFGYFPGPDHTTGSVSLHP